MVCLAALLNLASWAADTIGRLALRVVWGLLAGYALFVAGVLLSPPGLSRELALNQASFVVWGCAALCSVAIFLRRRFANPAHSTDANRAAIRDWSQRS